MNRRKDEDEMARGDGERKIEGEIGKREGQEWKEWVGRGREVRRGKLPKEVLR